MVDYLDSPCSMQQQADEGIQETVSALVETMNSYTRQALVSEDLMADINPIGWSSYSLTNYCNMDSKSEAIKYLEYPLSPRSSGLSMPPIDNDFYLSGDTPMEWSSSAFFPEDYLNPLLIEPPAEELPMVAPLAAVVEKARGEEEEVLHHHDHDREEEEEEEDREGEEEDDDDDDEEDGSFHERDGKSSRSNSGSNGQRRYVCSCGRGFSRKYNLGTHQQSHAKVKIKPFVCRMEGCEKTFGRKHDLSRHTLSVHCGIKRYSCPDCGRRFSRKDTLRK